MTIRKNNWLSAAAFDTSIPNYTSQRGEDRILQKIFEVIGVESKWCVEFGATNGKRRSNSWYWINEQGWSSVQIEAARDKHLNLRTRVRDSFDALDKRYKNNENVYCLNKMVLSVGPTKLDNLLATTPIPKRFDFISIDIDGAECDIWESLEDYTPRVVIVEQNKLIPVEKNFRTDRGSSLKAIAEVGKKKGYELVAANDLNGIFVLAEYFPLFNIVNNSPEELWQGHEKYTVQVKTRADGSLMFSGENRLRWVRGHDGTLLGQIKAGNYIVVSEEDTFLPSLQAPTQQVYISGLLRHIWYVLMNSQ